MKFQLDVILNGDSTLIENSGPIRLKQLLAQFLVETVVKFYRNPSADLGEVKSLRINRQKV